MVVTESLIHAVDVRFGAFAPVGQAEILMRMAMEMVLFPLVRVHALVWVVEILAAEGFGFLEAVGWHGEVDIQNQQQQGDAEASHHLAEVEPKTVFLIFFVHIGCKTKGKKVFSLVSLKKNVSLPR